MNNQHHTVNQWQGHKLVCLTSQLHINFMFTVYIFITLPHILAFPFKTGVDNIIKKIAGSRDVFGVLLLKDDDGSIISGIAASSQSPCK